MKWYSSSSAVASIAIVCLVVARLLSSPRSDVVGISETHREGDWDETISIETKTAKNKTVFCCGFDDQCRLWTGLLDDFQYGGRLMDPKSQSQPGDVLLMIGLDGPCDVSQDDIHDHFEGKVLFVNTESRQGGSAEKQRLSTRFYKIGPMEEEWGKEERTLSVYFGAVFWYTTTSPQQRAIFLQKERPLSDRRLDAVAFIASNCLPIRRQAASQLSAIVPVHHGKCGFLARNHTLHRIPHLTGRSSYIQNYKIYSQYRYCLVMENTQTSGYITEKIILAYLGGCIPIYWGTKEVFDVFHKESFIFYDIDNPDEALRELSLLQSNKTLLERKLQAPILANGHQTIEKYFSFSKDLGNGQLRKQIRQMMGILEN